MYLTQKLKTFASCVGSGKAATVEDFIVKCRYRGLGDALVTYGFEERGIGVSGFNDGVFPVFTSDIHYAYDYDPKLKSNQILKKDRAYLRESIRLSKILEQAGLNVRISSFAGSEQFFKKSVDAAEDILKSYYKPQPEISFSIEGVPEFFEREERIIQRRVKNIAKGPPQSVKFESAQPSHVLFIIHPDDDEDIVGHRPEDAEKELNNIQFRFPIGKVDEENKK